MSNVFRPFDKNDWYGWAGAEPFLDGSSPMIADAKAVDGRDVVILLDRNGIEINFLPLEDSETSDPEVWMMDEDNPALAKMIAEGLDLANADLAALGFNKLS